MRMKIGGKLIAGFMAVLLSTLIVGVFSITQLKKLDAADTDMYEHSVVALDSLTVVNARINQVQWRLRDLMLTEDKALTQKYKEQIAAWRAEQDKATKNLQNNDRYPRRAKALRRLHGPERGISALPGKNVRLRDFKPRRRSA